MAADPDPTEPHPVRVSLGLALALVWPGLMPAVLAARDDAPRMDAATVAYVAAATIGAVAGACLLPGYRRVRAAAAVTAAALVPVICPTGAAMITAAVEVLSAVLSALSRLVW